jgi:hypothetical protein
MLAGPHALGANLLKALAVRPSQLIAAPASLQRATSPLDIRPGHPTSWSCAVSTSVGQLDAAAARRRCKDVRPASSSAHLL